MCFLVSLLSFLDILGRDLENNSFRFGFGFGCGCVMCGWILNGEQKNSIAAIRSKHSLNFRIVSYLEAGSKRMDINTATVFKVSAFCVFHVMCNLGLSFTSFNRNAILPFEIYTYKYKYKSNTCMACIWCAAFEMQHMLTWRFANKINRKTEKGNTKCKM